MNVTAVLQKDEFGFSAFIQEIDGVNTQGDDLQEVKENLNEALAIIANIKGIQNCKITKEILIDKSEEVYQSCS